MTDPTEPTAREVIAEAIRRSAEHVEFTATASEWYLQSADLVLAALDEARFKLLSPRTDTRHVFYNGEYIGQDPSNSDTI